MRSSSSLVPRQGVHPGLEGLLEAAGDVVFRLTAAGEIRYANAGAIRLAGLPNGLRGGALAGLVAEADRAALRNGIADALANPQPALVEARLRSRDRDTWFELRIVSCPNLADDSTLLVIGRDS